jgi:cytochrome d ubiquinol oxidase subunit II
MDLGLIWLGIIAFSLLLYVILDGFALGVAILFPFLNSNQRDIATSVLLPTWDGNQTWLVLSLACFYGMFPIAFAFIFPKIYMSAVLLVVMILLRGICFEFRLKASAKGI